MSYVVIPAAGRGSRLESDGPKGLFEVRTARYPVRPLPLIDHALRQFEDVARDDQTLIVVNTSDLPEWRAWADRTRRGVIFVPQDDPRGMVDSLSVGLEALERVFAIRRESAAFWVSWCDVGGLSPDYIRGLDQWLYSQPLVTNGPIVPVRLATQPYARLFGTPTRLRSVELSREREGAGSYATDCGVFGFKDGSGQLAHVRGVLRSALAEGQRDNLLATLTDVWLTPAPSSWSVNTRADAADVERGAQ